MVEIRKRKKPNPVTSIEIGNKKKIQMPRHDEKILFLLLTACTETHVSPRLELKIIKTGFKH